MNGLALFFCGVVLGLNFGLLIILYRKVRFLMSALSCLLDIVPVLMYFTAKSENLVTPEQLQKMQKELEELGWGRI